jgi:hypothetical protein
MKMADADIVSYTSLLASTSYWPKFTNLSTDVHTRYSFRLAKALCRQLH